MKKKKKKEAIKLDHLCNLFAKTIFPRGSALSPLSVSLTLCLSFFQLLTIRLTSWCSRVPKIKE